MKIEAKRRERDIIIAFFKRRGSWRSNGYVRERERSRRRRQWLMEEIINNCFFKKVFQ